MSVTDQSGPPGSTSGSSAGGTRQRVINTLVASLLGLPKDYTHGLGGDRVIDLGSLL